MRWVDCPDEEGWWFFIYNKERWKESFPYQVCKIVDRDGNVKFVMSDIRETPISNNIGWWYGPFRVAEPTDSNTRK